ncbi:MAG TPA: ester cyclase [Thermoleophilaceae bacterium]|nr:ester cyclase [Thermoleophilaceae bacterium]
MLDEQFAREFAERYAEAWNSYDAERMEPLVTSDVVWLDPALPEPARGVEEVKDFMRRSWVAFPDLRFTPGPMWLDPHAPSMTWAWRMEGTHRGPIDPPGFAATGKRIDVDGIDVWDFADGRIERFRAYYDMAVLARQIGAMPPPGSPGERVGVLLQRTQARFTRR